MSPSLWAFLGTSVTALATLVVAVVNARLSHQASTRAGRAEEHAKRARDQVENSHPTNMRDEQDERHEEVMSAIGMLREDLGAERRDRAEADRAGQRDRENIRREIQAVSTRIDRLHPDQ